MSEGKKKERKKNKWIATDYLSPSAPRPRSCLLAPDTEKVGKVRREGAGAGVRGPHEVRKAPDLGLPPIRPSVHVCDEKRQDPGTLQPQDLSPPTPCSCPDMLSLDSL